MSPRSQKQKFQTVIEKNTFYYFDPGFEEAYEGFINALHQSLLVLQNEVRLHGARKEIFERFLGSNANGLRALLALIGLSNESLKRLITLIRIVDDPVLTQLTYREQWSPSESTERFTEWSDAKIAKELQENVYFRKGLVNLFFEGATTPFLAKTLPLFELKKLSLRKLSFEPAALLDTLVRYKEKGSYSGQKGKNPEVVIERMLEEAGIPFLQGDLRRLIQNAPATKRTMDFIVPGQSDPRLIIESSFLVTTSSGQGDKSKTELAMRELIHQHYPHAQFIGFVDGIGWYVRKSDLRRMVEAYDDVFTFHPDELERFQAFLAKVFADHA